MPDGSALDWRYNMNGLRAIMVSVEYTDLLAITLPYNRHHFDEVWIVTSPGDVENVDPIARDNAAHVVETDLFYANGARFNKWAALEYGLDQMGREGWICLMDADVLWPWNATIQPVKGSLTTPLRRMMPLSNPPRVFHHGDLAFDQIYPPESDWWQYPVHPNINEWAGYTQVFHADDPVLGPPPWHETDWTHAGGADSFFQAKWSLLARVRPQWDVLHLGDAGVNWAGRCTPTLDGKVHPQAQERQNYLRGVIRERWMKRGRVDRFEHEKLRPMGE